MEHHMNLKALSDFNLIAHHGGIGRAASATRRSKATLSRHLRDLESELGVRLLERGGRDLRLTEEGRALHERTGHLLAEIEEATEQVTAGTDQPRGRLRISAPVLFAHTIMGRIAAEFAAHYPQVRVDVTAEDRNVNIVEEGYDLVIRVNPERDSNLIGRCFLRDRPMIVAAPSVTMPDDDQPTPAVLLGHMTTPETWRLRTPNGPVTLRPDPILRLSSLFMMRDAVRTGIGAAVLPLSLVSRDLAHGRLVAWGDFDTPETEIWALYPSRRLLSRRVSAFLEYLRSVFPNATSQDLAAFIDD